MHKLGINPVNSEPLLKKFAPYLDKVEIKGVLQRTLPQFSDGHLKIAHCDTGYIWYKTYQKPTSAGKTTLSISYHLKIIDTATQKSGEQILYVKVYLENRSQGEFEKMKNRSWVSVHYGEPLIHLPKFDMIIWGFPNDPGLGHLPKCVDPEKVINFFPYGNLPAGLDHLEDLRNVAVEIIHYRPAVRCTSRYTLKWGDRSKILVLFGKTFKDDQGKMLYERSLELFRETQREDEHFLIAQPLGYDETIKTLWQIGLEGRALVDVMDEATYQPLLQSVAKGLARFHQSSLTSPVRVTITEQIVEVQKKIAKLIRAFPQLSDRLKSIEHSLRKDAAQLQVTPDTIIHADFSVQQLLVCGDKIACFDFDEFAMGNPAQDIANFIVDCYFRPFDADLVPMIISTFVHAYEEKTGLEISIDHLNWYIQMLFITKAYRFYLQQRPQLEKEIKAIICLAQKAVAR